MMRLSYVLKVSRCMYGLLLTLIQGGLLALNVSYGRSCLNATTFLKKALKLCSNKHMVIVDRGPWYP